MRVDVASTRTEFYDYPAALPKVEHASIRGDLARRDFSINAMAVSLNPRDFGALLDYFGGLGDLRGKRIRVLHNLSFIEDPTRIFRAVRYEDRYGLRMDRHTLALARACAEMDLVAHGAEDAGGIFDEAQVVEHPDALLAQIVEAVEVVEQDTEVARIERHGHGVDRKFAPARSPRMVACSTLGSAAG